MRKLLFDLLQQLRRERAQELVGREQLCELLRREDGGELLRRQPYELLLRRQPLDVAPVSALGRGAREESGR